MFFKRPKGGFFPPQTGLWWYWPACLAMMLVGIGLGVSAVIDFEPVLIAVAVVWLVLFWLVSQPHRSAWQKHRAARSPAAMREDVRVTETAPYAGHHAFLVVEVRADGLAGYVVGTGLAVGDVLRRLIPYYSERVGDRMVTTWHAEQEVSVVVLRIAAYGRDLDYWDPGMSALVVVETPDLDRIGPNVVLTA